MKRDISTIHGNTRGLGPSQIKRLQLLLRRRVPSGQIVTAQLASLLSVMALEDIQREVGVVLDRAGRVVQVVVGTSERLELPEYGEGVPGLRIVHAHPDGSRLRRDDLAALTISRLDAMAVVHRNEHGNLFMDLALPEEGSGPIQGSGFMPFQDISVDMDALFASSDTVHGTRMHDVQQGELAVLVVVAQSSDKARRRSLELKELARTAGLTVARVFTQVRHKPDSRTLVGSGKLEEILLEARRSDVDLIVFDPELTPAQAKAITQRTGARVIDRTMLILDIFAQHASTREAKLQVELAQLRYRLPHLSHRGNMMSRLMGGIGGRGPGETKLEIDRRRVRERIARLERRLSKMEAERSLRRKRRRSRRVPVVAIVGYTNVGKSTLLTALTGSEVFAENMLFATLSPRARRMRLDSGIGIVLTDTVGFIEDLPSDLQKAFRATLEEMRESDLLLHVLDASDPDMEFRREQVERILREMDLDSIPRLEVYNKCDLLDEWPQGPDVYISALSGRGLDNLRSAITDGLLLMADDNG